MNRAAMAGVAAVLVAFVWWTQREQARGTFDFVERQFVSWLAANSGAAKPLAPLTLVLYDVEASELAGTDKLALLDGTLFARAASRLGAVAAGVEGIQGDPSRMLEAAGRMPVFGGYDWTSPPGQGWSTVPGHPAASWRDVPGLAGRPGRFSRGFIVAPSGSGGPREILLVGRSADRAVPSFLVLAWAAAKGSHSSQVVAGEDAVQTASAKLLLDADGSACFLPQRMPAVMTMNELLVASEKFEREGGVSPFRGHVMVLARATPDVTRIAVGEGVAVTPLERWASAWEAVRTNRLFLKPGWWYPPLLLAAAVLLSFGPSCRSLRSALASGLLSVLVFALIALGAFGSARVLLPASPTLLTLGAALILGRIGHRTGWFGKSSP